MTENIQRRIASLLELAAHPATPDEERQRASEKAEALMLSHRIDRANLNFEARKQNNVVVEPEVRKANIVRLVDPSSLRASKRDEAEYEIQGNVNFLMKICYEHGNNRLRQSYDWEDNEYRSHFVIVGYPEDIFYGELLWNNVFLDVIRRIYPSWKTSESFDENVYRLKSAGFSWSQVREMGLANDAGDHNGKLTHKNAGSKLRTGYRRHCEKHHLPHDRQPSDPHHWRKSFVIAYASRLSQRLHDLRAGAEGQMDKKYLPVIQMDKDSVDNKFYELYPEAHPDEVERRRQEWLEQEAEREAKEEDNKKPKKVKETASRGIDLAAWSAGVHAAEEVDIERRAAAGDKKEELE